MRRCNRSILEYRQGILYKKRQTATTHMLFLRLKGRKSLGFFDSVRFFQVNHSVKSANQMMIVLPTVLLRLHISPIHEPLQNASLDLEIISILIYYLIYLERGREGDRQIDRQIDKWKDGWTDGLMDGSIDRQIDRQIDR